MTQMNRFLALIPVVAFAAACSGVAPTASSQITSNQPSEVSSDATAMALPVSCPTLTSISLDIVPNGGVFVWVQATYHHSTPVLRPCPAPRWTSDRNQMIVDRNNPMRAGYRRSAGGSATLTATVANRITKSILVKIGPTSSLVDPNQGACRAIAGVDLKTLTGPDFGNVVSFAASYVYKGPVFGVCATAPVWKATRRGITPQADPFRASIARATGIRTTVTATAPNGVAGDVTF
jgi:hypothetical protein